VALLLGPPWAPGGLLVELRGLAPGLLVICSWCPGRFIPLGLLDSQRLIRGAPKHLLRGVAPAASLRFSLGARGVYLGLM